MVEKGGAPDRPPPFSHCGFSGIPASSDPTGDDHDSRRRIHAASPDIVVPRAQRGRGAASDAAPPYNRLPRKAFTDSWEIEGNIPPLRAAVAIDRTRTIIANNASPDILFNHSISLCRGCAHGGIYRFSRPTLAHSGLSPGLNFEIKLLGRRRDAPRRTKQTPPCAAIAMTAPIIPTISNHPIEALLTAAAGGQACGVADSAGGR